jgi:alpha-L-fucosidase
MVYKPPELLVCRLIDAVAMNGNYWLNISPMADGTIPQAQQNLLLKVGEWLKINGEGIYGTRAWTRYGEGTYHDAPSPTGRGADNPPNEAWLSSEIRFTTKDDILYAFVMDWPADGKAVIKSLGSAAGKIGTVQMLGHAGVLQFTQNADALTVTFPPEKPCEHAYGLKITGLRLK